MSKRSISSFFQPSSTASKKARLSPPKEAAGPPSRHPSYPHVIECLPPSILSVFDSEFYDGKVMNDKQDLDMVFYQPFLSKDLAKSVYLFLRKELPFYRVTYQIKRGTMETTIRTPRYTTVFGVDAHSRFMEHGELLDAVTGKTIPKDRYAKYQPRPIPQCLEVLKNKVERETGHTFNFVLVNYYADTSDSISYHSDDERFLGTNPTIASLSLGSTRDFLMKHKSVANASIKLALASGEMVIMKGTTQKMWLHSIPKRTVKVDGGWTGGGRINITFRKALEKGGTGNYYNYNVGVGPVYRWNEKKEKMEEVDTKTKESDKHEAVEVKDESMNDVHVKKGYKDETLDNGEC